MKSSTIIWIGAFLVVLLTVGLIVRDRLAESRAKKAVTEISETMLQEQEKAVQEQEKAMKEMENQFRRIVDQLHK